MEIDEENIDDMVLALLYLTIFKDKPRWRAWKGHNWDALDRLHQKGYISDPATKAKFCPADRGRRDAVPRSI